MTSKEYEITLYDAAKGKINGLYLGVGYGSTANVFDVKTTQPEIKIGGECNGKNGGKFTIGADIGNKSASPFLNFRASILHKQNGNNNWSLSAGAGIRGRFDYQDSQIIKTLPGETVTTDNSGNSTWTTAENKNSRTSSGAYVDIKFDVPYPTNTADKPSAVNSSEISIIADTDAIKLGNTYKHREFMAQTNFTGEYNNPKIGFTASAGLGLNYQKDFNPDVYYVVKKGTQDGKTYIELNGNLYETPTPLKITNETVGAHNQKIFPSLNVGVEQKLLSFGKKGVVNAYANTQAPLNNLRNTTWEIGTRIGF